MIFIITESQNNRRWLMRRYDLVMDYLKQNLKDTDPCRFDSFDDYEARILQYTMDDLHHLFYDIEGFDYDGVMKELDDMFYVEITESYFRRDC